MIAAHFFDGCSARLHPARLEVRGGILAVVTPAFERSYALAEVALSEPFAAAPAMLRFADGACCEVADAAAREWLLVAIGYRKSRVNRWQVRWPAALLALALLAALLAALYLRGVPALTARIVAGLPPSVELELGNAMLSGLESRGVVSPSRLDERGIAEVQALLPAVSSFHPGKSLRLLVCHSDKLGANALALPDGSIIVTDDLVRLLLSRGNEFDDATRQRLIAVLAHEAGHIEHRHTARAVTGSSLAAALSVTMFGDFSALAAGLPAVLSEMQYSRAMEVEADDYAVAVLQRNRIRAGTFVDVLSRLEREQPAENAFLPRWITESMTYLSTHPGTAERIARIEGIERMQLRGEGAAR